MEMDFRISSALADKYRRLSHLNKQNHAVGVYIYVEVYTRSERLDSNSVDTAMINFTRNNNTCKSSHVTVNVTDRRKIPTSLYAVVNHYVCA